MFYSYFLRQETETLTQKENNVGAVQVDLETNAAPYHCRISQPSPKLMASPLSSGPLAI